jgi:hypothetical protein
MPATRAGQSPAALPGTLPGEVGEQGCAEWCEPVVDGGALAAGRDQAGVAQDADVVAGGFDHEGSEVLDAVGGGVAFAVVLEAIGEVAAFVGR